MLALLEMSGSRGREHLPTHGLGAKMFAQASGWFGYFFLMWYHNCSLTYLIKMHFTTCPLQLTSTRSSGSESRAVINQKMICLGANKHMLP